MAPVRTRYSCGAGRACDGRDTIVIHTRRAALLRVALLALAGLIRVYSASWSRRRRHRRR